MSSVPWGNETERADWYQHEYAEAYKELEHYRKLEEAGRLIELPCKVGTNTYFVFGHYSFEKRKSLYKIEELPFDVDMVNGWGEKFFLTKAEAEAKLAELEGETDD